ncbi:indolepyruvate ferredoxin oxidoreductase family protein [Ideonella sp. DXS29W]|uniref:Indolepyruvate ferredoxin oxidoreductase family protein n=1 Tax=Ideonella lacteola TaxID=2984193 RepID=A0ABU9BR37_9BURK
MGATLIRPKAERHSAAGGDPAAAVQASIVNGTQALLALLIAQRRRDRAGGLSTAAFVSGYRGSPLGRLDQLLGQQQSLLKRWDIEFLPAINEEFAATACLGAQRVSLDPRRRVDGVHCLWYGKGPGLDRAGDALRHGHVYGSSRLGGVLVVVGEDHGCMSSTMSFQSDAVMQAWSMPVLHPADVAEYIEFGLYGWALSRFSGAWVGFKAVSEVVASTSTVDVRPVPLFSPVQVRWKPPEPVHVRASDPPSLALEARLETKLQAVREFARVHAVDRVLADPVDAKLGVITVGKAHGDFVEVLRREGMGMPQLEAAGIRLYKVGLVYPLEPTRVRALMSGLDHVLVIEEKAPIVERQLRDLLYDLPAGERPQVCGKHDVWGRPLLPSVEPLRPSMIEIAWQTWRGQARGITPPPRPVLSLVPAEAPAAEATLPQREPYFCGGCPHSTSTQVPAGSRALAGIGCHFMASWMQRQTTGSTQMGGEGVDWIAASRFTREPHVFQNLGDGTYFHSGHLAIRQAVAAGTRVTFKLLFNDAVGMTGGQALDGKLTVPSLVAQVRAEGVQRIAVVIGSDGTTAWRPSDLPRGVSVHTRDDFDAVQRELREWPGVSVLVYDQMCASEKRRLRNRHLRPDLPMRSHIHQPLCDGCGECDRVAGCMAVVPVHRGGVRKRQVDLSACNADQVCQQSACHAFVQVHGGRPRRGLRRPADRTRLEAACARLPEPTWPALPADYNVVLAGVGGAGVVTLSQLLVRAADLDGLSARALDLMGFAQKGGAAVSTVRIAGSGALLNQARIDVGQAHALLACDLVVAAGDDVMATLRRGRTRVLAHLHETPTAQSKLASGKPLPIQAMLSKLQDAVGEQGLHACDAYALSERLLGDGLPAYVLLLGMAWQLGMLPVSLASLRRAIQQQGIDVELNLDALSLGRLAAARPQRLQRQAQSASWAPVLPAFMSGTREIRLSELIRRQRNRLLRYAGNRRLASRYLRLIDKLSSREAALGIEGRPLTRLVAEQFSRLLQVPDGYEVARRLSDGSLQAELSRRFEGHPRFTMQIALPWWPRRDGRGGVRKLSLGPWAVPLLRVWAACRVLRGTSLDLHAWQPTHRAGRALTDEYEAMLRDMLPTLSVANQAQAREIASLPDDVRGVGPMRRRAIAQVRQALVQARAQWLQAQAPVQAVVAGHDPAEGAAGDPSAAVPGPVAAAA